MWDSETALVRETDILRYLEIFDEQPQRDPDGRLLAPPLFLPPFHHGGSIGEDGRRQKPGELEIDVPAPHRLMAGSSIDFHEPIRSGDEITASTRVVDIYEKEGRSGPMLFIVTETRYEDHMGAVKRVERWTIIRR